MKKSPTAYIYTLGCRVNTCESLSLADRLSENGYRILKSVDKETPDLIVVNTCAVTAESERKSAKAVRSFHSKFPDAVIMAAGCAVQLSDGKGFEAARVLIGNSDKDVLAHYAKDMPKEKLSNIVSPDEFTRCSNSFSHTRYKTKCTVKIEDGCDSHCSYCIIPSLRGRVRSKDPDVLLEEIREKVESGAREIVLTGIETGSYGKELSGVSLSDILEKADDIDGLYLIRLGSMDPFCFNDGFISRIASLRHFEKHLHISVQSGSSKILALMRRKYNAEMLLERIKKLYRAIPGLMLSADVIVGFPGETEADFEDTCRFAKEAEFYHMHIFPYSEREGTEAATMAGSVPPAERRRRASELERINLECKRKRLNEAVGGFDTVHFETQKDGVNKGYTSSFIPVRVECDEDLRDKIFRVKIKSADLDGLCLTAELCEELVF